MENEEFNKMCDEEVSSIFRKNERRVKVYVEIPSIIREIQRGLTRKELASDDTLRNMRAYRSILSNCKIPTKMMIEEVYHNYNGRLTRTGTIIKAGTDVQKGHMDRIFKKIGVVDYDIVVKAPQPLPVINKRKSYDR